MGPTADHIGRGKQEDLMEAQGSRTSLFPVHLYLPVHHMRRIGSFRSIICGVGGAALGAKKSRAWYVSMVAPEPPAAHAMKRVWNRSRAPVRWLRTRVALSHAETARAWPDPRARW